MVLSYGDAKERLSGMWWAACGINALAVFIFLGGMFGQDAEGFLGVCISVAAIIGLCSGLYITFLSRFDSAYLSVFLGYYAVVINIPLCGAAMGFAVGFFGYPNLRWPLLFFVSGGGVVSLAYGVLNSARAVRYFEEDTGTRFWRKEIDKYVNVKNRTIDPHAVLGASYAKNEDTKIARSIVYAGIGIVPALFLLFTGRRDNVIYLGAAALLVGAVLVNVRIVGPMIFRLYLIRKIEREQGYRFANADYEQIQELRRHFRFARWLMKDYRPPQPLPDPEPEPDPFAPKVRSRTALKRITAQHDKTRRRK